MVFSNTNHLTGKPSLILKEEAENAGHISIPGGGRLRRHLQQFCRVGLESVS